MSFTENLSAVALLLAVMAVLSLVEALIPLQARGDWGRRHLGPNVALTLITFATNMVLNVPLLLGLVWLQGRGLGLFNAVEVPSLVAIAASILALDFAWYVTHVSMHRSPAMWRFHAVHHSDPAVDVTTAIRQHPVESLIRYVFLAAFAFAAGTPPAAFVIYRIWSAVHGQLEHANLRLPGWLDTAMTVVLASPNMHKVHHSRDAQFTDRNFGNIFSLWDRLFRSFMPASRGTCIVYGLDGHDATEQQTTLGLLAQPFRARVVREGT